MTTRKKLLLLAGAILLGGVAWWRSADGVSVRRAPAVAARPNPGAPHRTSETSRVVELVSHAPLAADAVASRRVAAAVVRALYRKEQLTRELDLEQLRYGKNYWESERRGRELAKLQQAREAMLKELCAEANQVLSDLFPGETGEAIALSAIFDAERAGPNVSFLSAEVRARFESEILADDSGRGANPERLREIAARVLSANENDSYRKWNESAAMALRAQLIGFNPTESEFVAILQDRRASAEDGEAREAPAELETALGAARLAELRNLKDPALHTALNDLQRLGLPLREAEWLATTRARAVAEIGEIWRSALVTDGIKREQVALVERTYSQAIAVKLGLPNATLDGLEPGS